MLDLRPNCECCDADLAADSTDARVCTFECTFCATCAVGLDGTCPNCLGNLVERPVRPSGGPTGGLGAFPAQTERVLSAGQCTHR
ncbi:MAG: DUF1272 domain-containing protein [Aquihabitans sp.]